MNAIKNFFVELWESSKESWDNFVNTIKTAIDTVIGFFTGLWEGLKEIWNNIKTFVSDTVTGIKDSIVNTFNNIVSGVKEKVSNIKNTIVDGFNQAVEFITSLPGKAIEWGKDFIQGLIDGIKSKISGITDSVKNVGSKIKEFLHFSRPDKGPLREYEKWMPDFMKGLAKGIKSNESIVIDTAASLAKKLAETVNMTNNVAYTASSDSTINLNSNVILDGRVIGKVSERFISSNQKTAQRMKGVLL